MQWRLVIDEFDGDFDGWFGWKNVRTGSYFEDQDSFLFIHGVFGSAHV